jgi:type I restriction-modification system DNA methylase subunit
MTDQNLEQVFLKELDDKLWKAADKLRNNLDAANYKHIVLGLIFLKYVSDAFEERQNELKTLFRKVLYANLVMRLLIKLQLRLPTNCANQQLLTGKSEIVLEPSLKYWSAEHCRNTSTRRIKPLKRLSL